MWTRLETIFVRLHNERNVHTSPYLSDLQSEHDTAARAILVSTSEAFMARVDAEVDAQLAKLPTAETARVAIEQNRWAACVLLPSVYSSCRVDCSYG